LVPACAALWFRDGLTDAYPRLERWLYELLGLHMEFFADLMHLTWDAVEETVWPARSHPVSGDAGRSPDDPWPPHVR
jgi:hypothetical protein